MTQQDLLIDLQREFVLTMDNIQKTLENNLTIINHILSKIDTMEGEIEALKCHHDHIRSVLSNKD